LIKPQAKAKGLASEMTKPTEKVGQEKYLDWGRNGRIESFVNIVLSSYIIINKYWEEIKENIWSRISAVNLVFFSSTNDTK
jgi:hypothetical protein